MSQPTEDAYEAAARLLFNAGRTNGIDWWAGSITADTRARFRAKASAIVDAVRAQIAAEIRAEAAQAQQWLDSGLVEQDAIDQREDEVRTLEWAARIAEGTRDDTKGTSDGD